MGEYLESKLEEMRAARPDVVKGVRGMGLLIALQLQSPIAPAVVAAANNEGVLLNPVLPDAIRFMPPLIITEADVDECIEKLNRAIDTVLAA
jgi:acetylornithine/succinyldiaminopimelate/putrescine aminotransferase